jgi:uncharacterized membrane protein YheB (UPF0754 family)
MSDDMEFEHVTTDAYVELYTSTKPIFDGVLKEVRELSRKKSEATMSASKVKLVNRILNDLLVFLEDEPAGKYLEALDDESLPQMSDAVLTMVQFESTLKAFYAKYYQHVGNGKHYWITTELLAEWDDDGEGEENEED